MFKLSRSILGDTTSHFASQFGRIRDLAIAPSGKVYFCTDNGNNSDVIVEVGTPPRRGDG